MILAGSGGSLSIPLDFHFDARHREVTEAELSVLRRTVRQVERTEGLNLGSDEPDPRPKLRKLSQMIERLNDEKSVQTVKNLLKEWCVTSPSALVVAQAVAGVLELWSTSFVEKAGLMEDEVLEERPEP